MSKMHFVTMKSIRNAYRRVHKELELHGFMDNKLKQIQVYRGFLDRNYGWQDYGKSRIIYIPLVSFSKLRDYFTCSYTSLADVLRHEYGHAVADTHRGLMRSRKFSDTFGGAHNSFIRQEYDEDVHITEYAAKNPAEDFAEVFMFYLKHKGKIPYHLDYTPISKKWRFIENLGTAIRKGKSRW